MFGEELNVDVDVLTKMNVEQQNVGEEKEEKTINSQQTTSDQIRGKPWARAKIKYCSGSEVFVKPDIKQDTHHDYHRLVYD